MRHPTIKCSCGTTLQCCQHCRGPLHHLKKSKELVPLSGLIKPEVFLDLSIAFGRELKFSVSSVIFYRLMHVHITETSLALKHQPHESDNLDERIVTISFKRVHGATRARPVK